MPESLLVDPERHVLRGAESARGFGPTAVLAPHADDESLGCGGLIATLTASGVPVRIVIVTDGTRSHPNSRSYPSERLRTIREREAQEAAGLLGTSDLVFLRHPDCGLPLPGSPAFSRAAGALATALDGHTTLLVPWRRDPHCDHEGTWELARAAVQRLTPAPRWIEYPIWAWTRALGVEAPQPAEATPWRLDITRVLERKREAIAAHRSQTTPLIQDDPEGFTLTPEVLAHFERPWELFLDPFDA